MIDKEHDRWLNEESDKDEIIGECLNCEEVVYNSERHYNNSDSEKIHEDCFVEYMVKTCGFIYRREFEGVTDE